MFNQSSSTGLRIQHLRTKPAPIRKKTNPNNPPIFFVWKNHEKPHLKLKILKFKFDWYLLRDWNQNMLFLDLKAMSFCSDICRERLDDLLLLRLLFLFLTVTSLKHSRSLGRSGSERILFILTSVHTKIIFFVVVYGSHLRSILSSFLRRV